jgi:RNA polymerase sigma-70 factor, ECF subfamily
MADRATFVADTEPYMRPLYSTAVRLTTNPTDAEDLVQETYLRAFRSYGTFESGSNVRAWLFRILTNAHINRYRAKKRRPEETVLDALDDGRFRRPVDGGYSRSAEDELFEQLAKDDVMAQVGSLAAPYRQTVLLADVEGLSYKEIAESLDIPIGTVMSRLHRGRRILRRSAEASNRDRSDAYSVGRDLD